MLTHQLLQHGSPSITQKYIGITSEEIENTSSKIIADFFVWGKDVLFLRTFLLLFAFPYCITFAFAILLFPIPC